MNRPHVSRFHLLLLGVTVCAASLVTGRAAAILPAGVSVLDPAQVLSDRSATGQDGTLYLRDLQGIQRRFITSIFDPAIRNRGDGSFHPVSATDVEGAIIAIDPRFLERLRFEALILPYPVSDPLGTWADGLGVYLCPGVLAIEPVQVHFLISHEAGHLVHRALLPDENFAGWARYRALRGIADSTRFNAYAAHRDRPHEIFAEDFRILFGSDEARRAGGIENPDLADPREVPGLREFFVSLLGDGTPEPATLAGRSLAVYPNPLARGDILRMALQGSTLQGSTSPSDLALFDVSGRRVREARGLLPNADGLLELRWNGLDDAGRDLPLGVYYGLLRTSDGNGASRFTLRLIR